MSGNHGDSMLRPAAETATGSSTGPWQPDAAELIRQHHSAVYRYAFRLAGNAADAEDLTQQVFLIACEKLHQLRQPDRADRWLFTILRNCFFKTRQKAGREPHLDDQWDFGEVADPRPLPDGVEEEALRHALAQLGPLPRTVLLMYYFEEASYKEISAALGIKMGTVMSRLSRAKQELKKLLLAEQDRSGQDRASPPPVHVPGHDELDG